MLAPYLLFLPAYVLVYLRNDFPPIKVYNPYPLAACVNLADVNTPGQFPNSSSQSSQVTTSSQQLVSCSCSLDGIEIYHTYTGEVQQENQTYYVNIIPYITPQPDGSYVTNEVTVTHNANNSAVTDVGSLSANQAPTWIVSGVTL